MNTKTETQAPGLKVASHHENISVRKQLEMLGWVIRNGSRDKMGVLEQPLIGNKRAESRCRIRGRGPVGEFGSSILCALGN